MHLSVSVKIRSDFKKLIFHPKMIMSLQTCGFFIHLSYVKYITQDFLLNTNPTIVKGRN